MKNTFRATFLFDGNRITVLNRKESVDFLISCINILTSSYQINKNNKTLDWCYLFIEATMRRIEDRPGYSFNTLPSSLYRLHQLIRCCKTLNVVQYGPQIGNLLESIMTWHGNREEAIRNYYQGTGDMDFLRDILDTCKTLQDLHVPHERFAQLQSMQVSEIVDRQFVNKVGADCTDTEGVLSPSNLAAIIDTFATYNSSESADLLLKVSCCFEGKLESTIGDELALLSTTLASQKVLSEASSKGIALYPFLMELDEQIAERWKEFNNAEFVAILDAFNSFHRINAIFPPLQERKLWQTFSEDLHYRIEDLDSSSLMKLVSIMGQSMVGETFIFQRIDYILHKRKYLSDQQILNHLIQCNIANVPSYYMAKAMIDRINGFIAAEGVVEPMEMEDFSKWAFAFKETLIAIRIINHARDPNNGTGAFAHLKELPNLSEPNPFVFTSKLLASVGNGSEPTCKINAPEIPLVALQNLAYVVAVTKKPKGPESENAGDLLVKAVLNERARLIVTRDVKDPDRECEEYQECIAYLRQRFSKRYRALKAEMSPSELELLGMRFLYLQQKSGSSRSSGSNNASAKATTACLDEAALDLLKYCTSIQDISSASLSDDISSAVTNSAAHIMKQVQPDVVDDNAGEKVTAVLYWLLRGHESFMKVMPTSEFLSCLSFSNIEKLSKAVVQSEKSMPREVTDKLFSLLFVQIDPSSPECPFASRVSILLDAASVNVFPKDPDYYRVSTWAQWTQTPHDLLLLMNLCTHPMMKDKMDLQNAETMLHRLSQVFEESSDGDRDLFKALSLTGPPSKQLSPNALDYKLMPRLASALSRLSASSDPETVCQAFSVTMKYQSGTVPERKLMFERIITAAALIAQKAEGFNKKQETALICSLNDYMSAFDLNGLHIFKEGGDAATLIRSLLARVSEDDVVNNVYSISELMGVLNCHARVMRHELFINAATLVRALEKLEEDVAASSTTQIPAVASISMCALGYCNIAEESIAKVAESIAHKSFQSLVHLSHGDFPDSDVPVLILSLQKFDKHNILLPSDRLIRIGERILHRIHERPEEVLVDEFDGLMRVAKLMAWDIQGNVLTTNGVSAFEVLVSLLLKDGIKIQTNCANKAARLLCAMHDLAVKDMRERKTAQWDPRIQQLFHMYIPMIDQMRRATQKGFRYDSLHHVMKAYRSINPRGQCPSPRLESLYNLVNLDFYRHMVERRPLVVTLPPTVSASMTMDM